VIITRGNFTIEILPVGQMAANCYIVMENISKELIVIDPGEDANYIADHVVATGGVPQSILATHGHFDHILGAHELQLTLGIPFYMNSADKFLALRLQETAKYFLKRDIVETPPVIDGDLVDKQVIVLGEEPLTVIETPGHTPGSICLYSESARTVFTGDTIFAGGAVGRTDFSYSEPLKLSVSMDQILTLPQDTYILSGHGDVTTVQREKEYHILG
jgi:hydroxyacylglutathione hydrolase